MTEWQDWEIDILKVYKKQATPVNRIAELLNKSEAEIKKQLEEIK